VHLLSRDGLPARHPFFLARHGFRPLCRGKARVSPAFSFPVQARDSRQIGTGRATNTPPIFFSLATKGGFPFPVHDGKDFVYSKPPSLSFFKFGIPVRDPRCPLRTASFSAFSNSVCWFPFFFSPDAATFLFFLISSEICFPRDRCLFLLGGPRSPPGHFPRPALHPFPLQSDPSCSFFSPGVTVVPGLNRGGESCLFFRLFERLVPFSLMASPHFFRVNATYFQETLCSFPAKAAFPSFSGVPEMVSPFPGFFFLFL